MNHSEGFLRLAEDAMSRVREVSVDEADKKRRELGAYLVDVREESEWNAGHAEDAIHLGKGIIERDIEKRVPDRTAPLYLYCGGGYRSALAADNLQKMGYRNVFSVAGGWKAWVKSGRRVSTRPEVVPRSPHDKLAGIMFLPRLIDKCRLAPQGKLPGYNYLTVGMDKLLLDFLCVEPKAFEAAVQDSPDDEAVLAWLKARLGAAWPAEHAIREFNERVSSRKPESPELRKRFDEQRAKLPPTRRKVETFCDLIDLEEGRSERLNALT